MHRRLQTNDAFAKFLFGQIISCRQDTDAPKGELWSKSSKTGTKAAPFYLVYQGVSAKKLILNGRTI
jgi:hypothetical protein